MAGTWSQMGERWTAWRGQLVDALLSMEDDTVVVTHFIAINAAAGSAIGDDRVVVFMPDNCSRTVIDTEGGVLRVVELGDEATTVVR
jgi:broad specificity phosphatase PhoE